MSPTALLVVLGLTGFAANIAIRIVDPIVPLLAREFDVAVTLAALLASAYTLPYALGQPVLGPLGDARGKARVMAAALFVLAGALAASMFAPDIATLAACRMVSGLAGGACIPLALAMIGDRYPLEQRQIAISRYLVAVIIGQISGAPLAGLLSESIGWRPVFGIAALVALAAGVAVKLFIKPRPDAVRPAFNIATMRATYLRILRQPMAKYCYAAVAAEGAFIYGFLPYVAAHLESRGVGSVKEAGFVVAGIGLGGLVFSLVVVSLLKHMTRTSVMHRGSVIIFAGMIAVGLAPTWPLEMLAFLAVGLGFYMLHTGIQIEATELAPDARGSAIALHAFSLFIGMAVGPLFYGAMIPLLGAPIAVAVGGAIVMGAGILVALKVARARGV